MKKSKLQKSNFILSDLIPHVNLFLHVKDRISLKRSCIYYFEYFIKTNLHKKINLVYIVDTTASMIEHIQSLLENISNLNNFLQNLNTSFSIIEFWDHIIINNHIDNPTNVSTNLTNIECNEMFEQMEIDRGGDIPEAVVDALHELNNLEVNKDDANFILYISDSYPHGYMYESDSYPNGCPCKLTCKNELIKLNNKKYKFIYYDLDLSELDEYQEAIKLFQKDIFKYVDNCVIMKFQKIKQYILREI